MRRRLLGRVAAAAAVGGVGGVGGGAAAAADVEGKRRKVVAAEADVVAGAGTGAVPWGRALGASLYY